MIKTTIKISRYSKDFVPWDTDKLHQWDFLTFLQQKGKVVEEFVADISDPMNRDMVETKLFGYKTINKKTEEINKYGYPRYMVSIVEIF